MVEELIPSSALHPGSLLDHEHAMRFSAHLVSMKEPPLIGHMKRHALDDVFRMTLFPSFSPAVCLRVTRRGHSRKYTLKAGRGRAGYQPEGLGGECEAKLPAKLWWELVNWLKCGPIWIPGNFVKVDADGQEFMTADGHNWLIEHVDRTGYRASVEHSPILPEWLEFELWAHRTFKLLGIDRMIP